MAGLSRRFKDAGYGVPKYRLPLHGRTLFAHSVDSFRAYRESELFLFVAVDDGEVGSFIRSETASLGIRHPEIVLLGSPTRGQAETVALGLQEARAGHHHPLTIFNIDTFRPSFRFPDANWMASADGYVEVMTGTDPGFSFVQPNGVYSDNRVLRTAEKQVISDLASTGIYYFRAASLFLEALALEREAPQAHELYVAPLYNHLIAKGNRIHYNIVNDGEVIFCGVPSQYEALRARPQHW